MYIFLDVDSIDSASECEEETVCPEECSCTGSFVDCRDRGLTEVPVYLPPDATEL